MADETKTLNGVLGRLPKWPRKALNNSVIAAEQAYRKRSGLPLLSDADMEALRTGVPMSFAHGQRVVVLDAEGARVVERAVPDHGDHGDAKRRSRRRPSSAACTAAPRPGPPER